MCYTPYPQPFIHVTFIPPYSNDPDQKELYVHKYVYTRTMLMCKVMPVLKGVLNHSLGL